MAEFGGVDLQDLLLPLLGGVAGSWNRDVGRGVALGTNIYRSLRDDKQNKQAAQRFSELLKPQIEELRGMTVRDEKNNQWEVAQTANQGLFGKESPTTPNPTPTHVKDVRFSQLFSDEPQKMSLGINQAQIEDLAKHPDTQGETVGAQKFNATRGLELQSPVTSGETTFSEAVELSSQPDEQALQKARFLEAIMLTAETNPGWAGGLLAQSESQGLQGLRDLDLLQERADMAVMGREQRAAFDIKVAQIKSALRRGETKLAHRLQLELYDENPWLEVAQLDRAKDDPRGMTRAQIVRAIDSIERTAAQYGFNGEMTEEQRRRYEWLLGLLYELDNPERGTEGLSSEGDDSIESMLELDQPADEELSRFL